MANRPTASDYDPYAHREPKKPVSDFRCLVNLVKSAIGTGLFAMPNAFANVGLQNGIIGTIAIGLLLIMCFKILLNVHYLMCCQLKKPTLTYGEVVVASLTQDEQKSWMSAEVATFLVDTMMLTCYIGVGSVYVVFISGIVQECFDPDGTIDQGYYALMLFPFVFVMNLTKNLSDIAIISVVGNLILFIATMIGIVYALKDGISDTWKVAERDPLMYPKFIGMVLFSMTSPGVVLALEHEMEKPWNYVKPFGVLNCGMGIVIFVHVCVGVVGYLKWGPAAMANFIRNHSEHDVATLIALIMQGLSIYFTYGLQCYVPITIFRNDYVLPALEEKLFRGTPFVWDLIVRFFLSLVTCMLAASFAELDLFTGLVGAICISALAVIIPLILPILVFPEEYRKLHWKAIAYWILLAFACFIILCAIAVNVNLIIQNFFKRDEEQVGERGY